MKEYFYIITVNHPEIEFEFTASNIIQIGESTPQEFIFTIILDRVMNKLKLLTKPTILFYYLRPNQL